MVQFSKLRLSGFKSFVDKTELDIGPGLNGIVGPNGCGKSNLVEALRWVMGESSAKRMRGGGMEDVIFAGTDKRSSRNFAEVSLLLDNSERRAPSAYNNSDELEVVRKIEKDKGSGYKINGRNARARDVQMLFADTVTGANSPSLVSQGHVTRMINAKPQDRRLILEESAGIAGLYARRHEAELRLKAADSNLLRLEDIVGSMEGRLNSLKRQARQASKYKNISAQIRQLELVITYLEWQALVQKQNDIKLEFNTAESVVADKLTTVTQLTKTQNTQIEELPPLRKQEMEAAAELQKYKLEFQRLEDEITRHKNDVQDAKTQIHQTNIDLQHEEQTLEETTQLLDRIDIEFEELKIEQSNSDAVHEDKKSARDALNIEVIQLEERFSALKESAAATRARENALSAQIERNENRMAVLLERKETSLLAKDNLVIDLDANDKISQYEQQIIDFETHVHKINDKTEGAKAKIIDAEDSTDKSRIKLSDAEKAYAEFSAEIGMLERFFQNNEAEDFLPVLDSIITEAGFERALSRALGDSLMASLDENAPSSWSGLIDGAVPQELPTGMESLLPHVQAPDELKPSLSQIGFIDDSSLGDALIQNLKVGQSLVAADGTYWRWDGYCVKAHATDHHSIHLEQKNKLIELEAKRDDVQSQVQNAQEELSKTLSAQQEAKDFYNNLLDNIKNIEAELRQVRPALQSLKDKNVRVESEQKRFSDQIKTIEEDIKSLSETIVNDKAAYDAVLDSQSEGENSADLIETVKLELEETKENYHNAVREYDRLAQEQSTRSARIQAIADERISLKNRAIRGTEQTKKLRDRQDTLNTRLKELKSKPLSAPNSDDDMLSFIAELETKRTLVAERLARCEEDVSITNKALKEAESILGSAREDRARAQAMYASVNEQLSTLNHDIEEKFEMKPQALGTHIAVDLVKYQSGDLPALKSDKEKLTRQRDMIGSVNLCAEEEADTLEAELTTLLHERNDLMQAIEELRGGINKINKEARERLKIAFDHVNAHFQRLFMRLFKGGKAYLELIESDDPLGAGLEIYAQPPGKSLQALSLLSGGEQTLASIALIFGMFLTNPSPICVLDEIDAPLDDANVDRVCDLLDEIAERGETRFLVITHHRLSMARMDRLYGVTMYEKGVSQLVSVDLQKSFEFIDQQVA